MPLEHTLPPSLPRAVLTARRLVAQIMQGRITKVLNMKPQEILGLIEEAAGTRMFELKKQQAVKTIEKKETKLAEIDKVFEEDLTPRLEKLGSERAEYLEYKKSEQDVETLGRVCQAHDYFSSERAQQKCTEALEEGKARQVELAAAIAQAEQDKVAKKEQKARALAKKSEDGAGEMKALESEESELSKQLVKLTLTLTLILTLTLSLSLSLNLTRSSSARSTASSRAARRRSARRRRGWSRRSARRRRRRSRRAPSSRRPRPPPRRRRRCTRSARRRCRPSASSTRRRWGSRRRRARVRRTCRASCPRRRPR